MPNYQNGKIYKLVCSDTGNIYVGSTCKTLNARLSNHKSKTFNQCSSKSFINPKIVLIESFSCNSKQELELKEREYKHTYAN